MTLLDRRLAGELVGPLLAGVLVFIGVILVNTIVQNTAAVFTLGAPWPTVFRWLLYRVPIILTYALPVGTLLACSLVIIRQTRDNEMTAWRMGGVSLGRLFRPTLVAGALLSLLAVANNELVAPRYRLKANQVLVERILRGPGAWVKTDLPFRAGDNDIAHVGRVDLQQHEMTAVLIYKLRDGLPVETLTSPRCVLRDGQWWLIGGWHYWFEHGEPVRREPIVERRVDFAPDLAEIWNEETEPQQMPAVELYRRMRLYEQAGDGRNAVRMRYFLHSKFALPATCLIFALLAAPLSFRFTRPQTNPYAGVLVTIIVVFFCNGTINWAKAIALGPQSWLPPTLAAWLHVLLFGGLAVGLIRGVGR